MELRFPVKVTGVDLSKFKKVTDSDSVSITVTNRGQTSTQTYTGKDALFENSDYAYYVLSEVRFLLQRSNGKCRWLSFFWKNSWNCN